LKLMQGVLLKKLSNNSTLFYFPLQANFFNGRRFFGIFCRFFLC
jgi:hypothetical protein